MASTETFVSNEVVFVRRGVHVTTRHRSTQDPCQSFSIRVDLSRLIISHATCRDNFTQTTIVSIPKMTSRSPSRGRYRSRTRSPTPCSDDSRSPDRRRRYDSRSVSRSRSPAPPRRNGRLRSESRSRSRSRNRDRDGRDRSISPPAKSTKVNPLSPKA
jgi:hypothetical protein